MPCFQVMVLWKRAKKFLFSKGQVCSQIILCQVLTNVNVKWFYIVTHSNTVSFSIKTFFIILTTLLISNTGDLYTKLSRLSENSVKKKFRHVEIILSFWLRQELFASKDFYMETSLRNISKTRNAMVLTETILESTCAVVKLYEKERPLDGHSNIGSF